MEWAGKRLSVCMDWLGTNKVVNIIRKEETAFVLWPEVVGHRDVFARSNNQVHHEQSEWCSGIIRPHKLDC